MISGRFERKITALEPLFCGANCSSGSSITEGVIGRNVVSECVFPAATRRRFGRRIRTRAARFEFLTPDGEPSLNVDARGALTLGMTAG